MHARYIFLLLTAISLIIFYTHLVPFATLASTYLLFSRRPIQTLDPTTFDFNVPHYTNETTVVPRIIHQIKFGGPSYRMKSDWTRARTSCIALHPGWEVKLWEDEEANEFVLEHYGEEFHALYRGYEQGELKSFSGRGSAEVARRADAASFVGQRSCGRTCFVTLCCISKVVCTWILTLSATYDARLGQRVDFAR